MHCVLVGIPLIGPKVGLLLLEKGHVSILESPPKAGQVGDDPSSA